jgi:hypothetical protein
MLCSVFVVLLEVYSTTSQQPKASAEAKKQLFLKSLVDDE